MPSCSWPVKETKATGAVREFTTKKLPAGSEWDTYAIRAVIERDGEQVVREQNVSLKAGESREISFDFNNQSPTRSPTRALARSKFEFASIFRNLPIGAYPVGRLFLLNCGARDSAAGQGARFLCADCRRYAIPKARKAA